MKNFIKQKPLKKRLKKKFIFFADFETVIFNNQHYVSCISIRHRLPDPMLRPVTYCINEYKNGYNLESESAAIMSKFIDQLFRHKDKQEMLIYFHNLGKFDGIFLLHYFTTFNKKLDISIDIITRENTIYEITFKRIVKDKENDDMVKIIKFRDSYLLFPSSLKEMAEIFNSPIKKNNFHGIEASIDKYTDNFRKELIKYCEDDVEILGVSMEKYEALIWENYKINIYDNLTLSALAFTIFRTNFYKCENIYQSHGFLDEYIRQSYRGGVVDVYRPILEKGYYYDVNSLYPYVMANFDMPIGKPIKNYIKDSSSFDIQNFFGFIKVKVKCPDSLYIPFLTVKDKELGLISPTGEWKDTYFSEEIKYALTLGYQFEYIDYYQFERGIIFNNYVESIYNKRLESKKLNSSLSNVFKLLLNSLYGRFGMKNSQYKNVFLKNINENNKEFEKILLIFDTNIISTFKKNSSEELTLVRYDEIPNRQHLKRLVDDKLISKETYEEYMQIIDDKTRNKNIAVHIASAITAYARIYMHKLKMKYANNLYYSDTDSLITNIELDKDLISDTQIGLLKQEHKIRKAIFIAPKLYFMELENGEIKKSKGIDSKLLNYDDFLSLYNQKTLNFNVTKNFLRNLKNFTIGTKEHNQELKGILYKRGKVYEDNKWVNTKPIKINKQHEKRI